MAYRLSYPTNRALAIAITVTDPGHANAHADNPLMTEKFHLLAIDSIPLDDDDRSDRFSMSATLIDQRDHRIEIHGRDPDGSIDLHDNLPDHLPIDGQFFGGVLSNQYVPAEDGTWHFQPLKAWGVFDISAEDEGIDGNFFGLTEIMTEPDRLRLTLYGQSLSPLCFEWEKPPYLQVPTIVVRAEQNDTLTLIAQDMGVDIDTIFAANVNIESVDQPIHGELITVPLVPAKTRKVSHPSTSLSLTWKEISTGWTMRN